MEEYDTLGDFLEHVSLVMDNDASDGEETVTIMTMHAAKGMEFDHVFLPGWEEGVFPSQRALDEGGMKSLEEERRLAYVAITRARRDRKSVEKGKSVSVRVATGGRRIIKKTKTKRSEKEEQRE